MIEGQHLDIMHLDRLVLTETSKIPQLVQVSAQKDTTRYQQRKSEAKRDSERFISLDFQRIFAEKEQHHFVTPPNQLLQSRAERCTTQGQRPPT